MSSKTFTLGSSLLALALVAPAVFAADTYQASLEAGDAHRDKEEYPLALKEFGQALEQAANTTEQALALSKKAEVQAFHQEDCSAARVTAEEALALADVRPVGRVIALRVLAECQKRAEAYDDAIATLLEATSLEGVDWAQPNLVLLLGDCYRFSGDLNKALEVLGGVENLEAADAGAKAVAQLNMAFTYHYGLKDFTKARASYQAAATLQPSLQQEIDGHLAKLPAE